MKLEISKYLKDIKPILNKLLEELLKDFRYVSILATDSFGKRFVVSKNTVSINDGAFIERGFVVKVYNGIGYSEYAFNYINEGNFNSIIEDVKNNSKISIDNNINVYQVIDENEVKFSKGTEINIHPKDIGDKSILESLSTIKDEGISLNESVVDFRVFYEYMNVNKIFLSSKKDLEQSLMWGNGMCLCIAADKNGNKIGTRIFSGAKGGELLNEMNGIASELVDETVKLLSAKKIVPGEYDVICTPDITGLIVHEAFGHGVEMDMFLKDRAKSKDFMGEYVASDIVTMHDGAMAIEETGSYFFDDEGNMASDTIIIKNGVLKTGINDSLTALALNEKTTGNGRRQSFDRKAYSRMTNTYIEYGDSTVDEMIKSIKYGFLIDSAQSGMEDPKNWGIQCIANIGKEIKDGKLTGNIFSPIIITGYVPDLLKSISMISNEFGTSGTGYCGKGYKEFVKVSAGGPYIKCKARLG